MPQKWKGGTGEAQKRYREKHREILRERHRNEYQQNKERYKQYSSVYRKANKEKVFKLNATWQRNKRAEFREIVVSGYGHKCVCCTESETLFLEIHHPNGDGKADRARTGGNSLTFYRWIAANNFPQGYELLCANCHRAIHQSGDGICPHKKKNQF